MPSLRNDKIRTNNHTPAASIFNLVASPGSLVALHLGSFAQPKKNPRRPRLTMIAPPHLFRE